jgi:hypothetical protein
MLALIKKKVVDPSRGLSQLQQARTLVKGCLSLGRIVEEDTLSTKLEEGASLLMELPLPRQSTARPSIVEGAVVGQPLMTRNLTLVDHWRQTEANLGLIEEQDRGMSVTLQFGMKVSSICMQDIWETFGPTSNFFSSVCCFTSHPC